MKTAGPGECPGLKAVFSESVTKLRGVVPDKVWRGETHFSNTFSVFPMPFQLQFLLRRLRALAAGPFMRDMAEEIRAETALLVQPLREVKPQIQVIVVVQDLLAHSTDAGE